MENASPANLRLFTGLEIEIHPSLAQAVKKTRIGADRREMEINWVPAANYHVTLNFIGATSRERLPLLTALLDETAADHAPFTTELRGMGGFPDDRHMRTLWVGVRKTRALQELQDDLRTRLIERGFEQEDRPYSPHLTIGKTRKARNGSDLISPFVRTRFGEITVNSLVLFESLQHGPNVSYHVLARTGLNAALARSREKSDFP
jgi:2'-5' RNA ligase